ncbi:MAG: type 4a pilus biogenesis protein PilO [Candidatus Uhrbacteria bacterium]
MRRPSDISVLIASAVLLMAITGVVIIPTINEMLATHAATVAEHMELERRYQQGRILSNATRELNDIRPQLVALSDRIPHERDALDVVKKIEQIARRRAVTERLTADETQGALLPDGIRSIPISIEMRGNFHALLAVLRDLEHLPLPPIVDKFTMAVNSYSAPPPAPADLTLHIEARTYWRTDATPTFTE